jgi:diphthamide biosynthesis protein 2
LFKPIVTPSELRLALREEVDWMGRFAFDFEEITREGENEKENREMRGGRGGNGRRDLDETRFSLVTGKWYFGQP